MHTYSKSTPNPFGVKAYHLCVPELISGGIVTFICRVPVVLEFLSLLRSAAPSSTCTRQPRSSLNIPSPGFLFVLDSWFWNTFDLCHYTISNLSVPSFEIFLAVVVVFYWHLVSRNHIDNIKPSTSSCIISLQHIIFIRQYLTIRYCCPVTPYTPFSCQLCRTILVTTKV